MICWLRGEQVVENLSNMIPLKTLTSFALRWFKNEIKIEFNG